MTIFGDCLGPAFPALALLQDGYTKAAQTMNKCIEVGGDCVEK